jgi:hypothetical protein
VGQLSFEEDCCVPRRRQTRPRFCRGRNSQQVGAKGLLTYRIETPKNASL